MFSVPKSSMIGGPDSPPDLEAPPVPVHLHNDDQPSSAENGSCKRIHYLIGGSFLLTVCGVTGMALNGQCVKKGRSNKYLVRETQDVEPQDMLQSNLKRQVEDVVSNLEEKESPLKRSTVKSFLAQNLSSQQSQIVDNQTIRPNRRMAVYKKAPERILRCHGPCEMNMFGSHCICSEMSIVDLGVQNFLMEVGSLDLENLDLTNEDFVLQQFNDESEEYPGFAYAVRQIHNMLELQGDRSDPNIENKTLLKDLLKEVGKAGDSTFYTDFDFRNGNLRSNRDFSEAVHELAKRLDQREKANEETRKADKAKGYRSKPEKENGIGGQ